jgi:hypothetical protein
MTPDIGTPIVLSVCRLAALFTALAGCSAVEEKNIVDPNVYPTTYKADLLAYLQNRGSEMENVREAYISTPALTQFGGSQRYVVCLRTDGEGGRREKMVVFFSGQINQYVDATSQQCGAAAYQPLPELAALVRQLRGKK